MIFCEPCCGSAAVTIRLLQRYGKPPISYMGGKSGYADTILDALGLVPGQGCDGIVLADVGPWAAVWATLGGAMPPGDAAKWMLATRWSFSEKGPERGYGGPGCPANAAENPNWKWTTEQRDAALGIPRLAALIEEMPLSGAQAVANIIRQWKDEEPRALWNRLKAEGWPSLLPVKGGRWLGPQSIEEVARWQLYQAWCPQGRYMGPDRPSSKRETDPDWVASLTTDGLKTRVETLPTFPPLACYQGSANEMLLPDDLTGWIMYLDGPYEGTSGYPFGTFNRAQQVEFALKCSASGAIVAVSEAVRLDNVLGDGWFSVQIDHARRGAKRTFSRQQDEWLTLNRPPCHIPPKQTGLFS